MGFPNVDIFLVNRLVMRFTAIIANPAFYINDLFEDLETIDREEIARYIDRKVFTKDLRDRSESAVYIMPHFPLLDMPLPQIGISLGNEQTAERYLHDTVGDSKRYPDTDEFTHWDVPKGYWATATYQIDVAAATKLETIWLARFVQRFIMEEQESLDQIGVKEVNLSLQDMRINPEQMPMMVFNRAIQMSCKIANTWTKRIPVNAYADGNNLAL